MSSPFQPAGMPGHIDDLDLCVRIDLGGDHHVDREDQLHATLGGVRDQPLDGGQLLGLEE